MCRFFHIAMEQRRAPVTSHSGPGAGLLQDGARAAAVVVSRDRQKAVRAFCDRDQGGRRCGKSRMRGCPGCDWGMEPAAASVVCVVDVVCV